MKRSTTGTVAGAGGTATATITFDTPFADTNYTVAVSVIDAQASAGIEILRVLSKSTTGVTVRVVNNALDARAATLDVVAIHD